MFAPPVDKIAVPVREAEAEAEVEPDTVSDSSSVSVSVSVSDAEPDAVPEDRAEPVKVTDLLVLVLVAEVDRVEVMVELEVAV